MTQKTKSANIAKFEAGDRPTDQDFIDLFDSILFLNNEGIHDNGLSTNDTTILGDLNIGGNLDIQGAGNILIEGSFSAGNVSAGVGGGKISAFTSIDSPPFYASSSISTVMFSGISSKTTSSIALTTKGSDELTSGDVRFGIENGKGFLDAQGTTIISYSTGSTFGSGTTNIIHLSGSVGIGSDVNFHGVIEPSDQLEIFAVVDDATMRLTSVGASNDSIIKLRQSNNTGMDLIYDGGVDKFYIKDNNNNDRITISNTNSGTNAIGNVGINQLTPTEILDIVGNFRANGNGLFSLMVQLEQLLHQKQIIQLMMQTLHL